MNRKIISGALPVVSILAIAVAFANSPSAYAQATPAGFTSHVQPVTGGHVDWTEGCIVASGHGEGHGTDQQEQLLAQRAAELDAAANALAIALGIAVDDTTRAGAVHNGRVRIEGVVKGHQLIDVQWMPQRTPPQCCVKLQVPLWGVKGVASVFEADQRHKVSRGRAPRLALITEQINVEDAVLVIDARGTGLESCLFPVVLSDDGAVLYDVSTARARPAGGPVVQYVESQVSFKALKAGLESPSAVRLLSYGADEPNVHPTTQPTTTPTSQPADESRRRRRRRVVQAVAATGQQNTQIVLTEEDAAKLRRDPEAASLLRKGQVMVVVDSAAAGIEARRGDPQIYVVGNDQPGNGTTRLALCRP
jgi:hypothetical protein